MGAAHYLLFMRSGHGHYNVADVLSNTIGTTWSVRVKDEPPPPPPPPPPPELPPPLDGAKAMTMRRLRQSR